jgi:hypothetical protein
LPPKTLVETTNSIVGIGGTLSVGDAVKEVAVVGSLLPHAFHLVAAWLEVAKVLLTQPGLLIHLDVRSAKRRRVGVVRSQAVEDAFCCLPGSAVGGCEEVEGVVGAEQFTKTAASIVGLVPALWCELYSVIRHGLVNITVLWRGCKPGV